MVPRIAADTKVFNVSVAALISISSSIGLAFGLGGPKRFGARTSVRKPPRIRRALASRAAGAQPGPGPPATCGNPRHPYTR
eukprot:scaffold5485_cov55-Phaeocystis_antarctica.AAC.2